MRRYGGHLSDKQSARAVLTRGISSLALRIMIKHTKHTRSVQKRPKGQINTCEDYSRESLRVLVGFGQIRKMNWETL